MAGHGVADKSDVLWVAFSQLGPTQFSIGEYAMMDKVKKMRKKAQSMKLEKYLLKRAAPAFKAIDGRFYITDRHHTSRAAYELYKAGESPLSAYPLVVDETLVALDLEDFFRELKKRGLIYSYLRGSRRPISTLPHTLDELEDDAYRSLSWMVREAGGYDKVKVPYLEFLWADYLRSKLFLSGGSQQELQSVLILALGHARSLEARHLPGFKFQHGSFCGLNSLKASVY